jgi:hypothetical protein
MNTTLKVTGLAIALGGCGSDNPQPAKMTPAEVSASLEKSFDRLNALQVFPAYQLVLNLPAEATACYGVPCDSKWQKPYDDERARQAPRLAKLADIAEAVVNEKSLAPQPIYDSDAAVKALADLQIVTVDSLIQVAPANNPECYNLPCPSDQQAADATNQLHVAQALAIAEAAKKSGL